MPGVKVGVLGPGAIGGLIAGRLASLGAEVTVLARDRTAGEIAVAGLTITDSSGRSVQSRPHAAAWLSEPVDVLFVTVKSTQLLAALDRAPAGMTRGATVIPLLNGTDHVPLLRALRPEATVVAATIRVEASRTAPGVIEQLSNFADISLAMTADVPEAAREVVSLLGQADFEVSVRADELLVLWQKLSFLAPFALLTTATAAALGEARTKRPEWVESLVREATSAAASRGAHIDPDPIIQQLRQLPASMKSSMLRDFEAGNELELDAIGGPILRALPAESTPATRAALAAILAATK